MSLSALTKENYRFITFVRNPYTRMCSCYRDKILGSKPQKRAILRRLGYSGHPIETPVSFEEFAKAAAGQSDREMDNHWRVQSSQILYGIVEYAFVGRFEQYAADWVEGFSRLGFSGTEMPESRQLNRTKTGEDENCDKYYTKELQDLIYRRYKKDFDNFGYAYELPR
jgi:hypothetical protein